MLNTCCINMVKRDDFRVSWYKHPEEILEFVFESLFGQPISKWVFRGRRVGTVVIIGKLMAYILSVKVLKNTSLLLYLLRPGFWSFRSDFWCANLYSTCFLLLLAIWNILLHSFIYWIIWLLIWFAYQFRLEELEILDAADVVNFLLAETSFFVELFEGISWLLAFCKFDWFSVNQRSEGLIFLLLLVKIVN